MGVCVSRVFHPTCCLRSIWRGATSVGQDPLETPHSPLATFRGMTTSRGGGRRYPAPLAQAPLLWHETALSTPHDACAWGCVGLSRLPPATSKKKQATKDQHPLCPAKSDQTDGTPQDRQSKKRKKIQDKKKNRKTR